MCTLDTCHPSTGCVNVENECLCDDFDACSIDSCDPTQGCVYDWIVCGDFEQCDTVLGCIANGLEPHNDE